MPSKPTDPQTLNIAIDEDGTATLTGINYADLRSLLTAASLYRHDHGFEAKPLDGDLDEVVHRNNIEEFLWFERERMLLDVLKIRMDAAIDRSNGKTGNGNIEPAILMYDVKVKEAENIVGEAEIKAASVAAGPQPDPVKLAAAEIDDMLSKANAVAAKLKMALLERP